MNKIWVAEPLAMRHRQRFATEGMTARRGRMFASFVLVVISVVTEPTSGVVAETFTTTTPPNERPTPPTKNVKTKTTLPTPWPSMTLSPSSATAAVALPTLTFLLPPAASSYSAVARDVTSAALASAVPTMTRERQDGAAGATTVEAAVARTRSTSSIPAEAPAVDVGEAIAVELPSIAPVQVTSQTLATDAPASQLAEKPSAPSSKSKSSRPAPPPTLLKEGENCTSSAECKDGCCRRADGTLVDVFGHDGIQAHDVIVPMHGICSKKLGEVSEYCGSGCKCKGGLSCYKPRNGVCCQPELCYDQSFVNRQKAYLKRCQSRRGCVMPPQFDD